MTSPIDTVSVEVQPDFSSFDSVVDRQISAVAREIESVLRSALESIARESGQSADQIAENFQRSGEQVERALDEVQRAADGAGDDIANEFQQGGERAEDALREVGNQGERQFDRIEREANEVNGRIGTSFGRLGGILAGAFAAVQVGQFLRDAVLQADALGDAMAISEQIIGQTQGAAGLLAEDIRSIAQELSLEIGVDSVQVQEAANVLLTFRNVSSETFDTALGLAADLSTVMGTDLQGATLQLGKALNDPVRGISALARAGVQFTQAQKDQIAALVESGDILGAQQIILQELESQVGGTAAVSADSWQIVTNAFRETQRELGSALIPALDAVAPALIGLTQALGPVFTSIGEVLGGLIEQLAPIIDVLGAALAEGLSAIMPAIAPIGEAFLSVVEAVSPLLPVLGQLLGTILPPLANVLGIVAEALAPLIEMIGEHLARAIEMVEPFLPPIVEVFGEIAAVVGEVLNAVFPILSELILTLLSAILPLIPVLLELVRALLPMLDPIMMLIQALLPPLVQLLTSLLIPIIGLLDPIIQLATMLAEALAPAQEEIINLLIDALVPLLTLLAEILMITVVPAVEFLSEILQGNFADAFENAGGQIGLFRDIVMAVFNFVREHIGNSIDRVRTILNGIESVVSNVIGFFTGLRDGARDRFNSLVDFVRGIPGRILSALGNVSQLLRDAGRRVIGGLMEGVRSMIPDLGGVMSDVVSTIRDFLPFSPAKVGPLSGSGSPDMAGEAIGDMIAVGIQSTIPDIRSATSDFAQEIRSLIDGEIAPTGGVAIGPGDTITTTSAEPAFDVRVFIGERELTEIVDVQISERNRTTRRRVGAGTGAVR